MRNYPAQRWFCHITLSAQCVIAMSMIAVASGDSAAFGTNSPSLSQLQEQLDAQTKRIDRLYRALGPQLAELEERAAEFEKQQAEDKALALEPIRVLADESLRAIGCMNPVTAEFGALTTEGGVRIFDAVGEPVKELRQPGQDITCLAFSPDGSELLTGTASGSLIIWNVASGSTTVVCTNVDKKVDRVAWLGHDRVAWQAYQKYWESGKPVDHDKPAGAVLAREGAKPLWQFGSLARSDFYTLAGAQDGSRLAILEIPGQPRGAFLLDGMTGNVLHTCYDKEHGSGPLSVAISPDGNTLAVGYAPYDIILWNAKTGARQKLLKGHSNWVVSLAFSADSTRLISGAGDSTARVWDVQRGKEIGRIRFPGESTYVKGVGLSPNGEVAFASVRRTLNISRLSR